MRSDMPNSEREYNQASLMTENLSKANSMIPNTQSTTKQEFRMPSTTRLGYMYLKVRTDQPLPCFVTLAPLFL